jgi:ComF family protein
VTSKLAANVRESVRAAADLCLDFLFPPQCPGCRKLGDVFCPICAQHVEPILGNTCTRCGRAAPQVGDLCRECSKLANPPLRFVRAAAYHTWPLREAIHAFKYQHHQRLAEPLARYLVAVFAQPPWTLAGIVQQQIDAVVPVPLHAQRRAERGYNQSELLAASFCRSVGLPLRATWLERTRVTKQQIELTPQERARNVAGAFVASPEVAGKTLLLVDDVYTTGATLTACAAAAREQGAAQVLALALATPKVQRAVHQAVS